MFTKMEKQSSIQGEKQKKKMHALYTYKSIFFFNQQMDPYILEPIHNEMSICF